MKKAFLLGLALLFSLSMSAQRFALKNNLLYDATTTPNLGFEVGLSKKVTTMYEVNKFVLQSLIE